MNAAQEIDRIPTVTSDTFQSTVIDGKGPIVVEFMSYGCGHCRAIEPVLQEVAAKVEPGEKMYRVNVAIEPGLVDTYAINGTPTIVMFRDGSEVGRVEGPRPALASLLSAVTRPFER
jgi:thioredoxin 1